MLPEYLTNPNRDIYRSNNYVVLDYETTNLDKGSAQNPDNRLVSTCYKHGGRVYLNSRSEYDQDKLVEACEKADFIVAQFIQFEIAWLERCGLDTSKCVFFDTMLAEYVILGNRKEPLDLDSLAIKYGGRVKSTYIKTMMKAGICPSDMPRHTLLKYNVEDVENCEKVFLAQREIMYEKGLISPFYNRCMFSVVLVDIKSNGMCLDKSRVAILHRRIEREYLDIERKLNEFTGGINFRSSKQMAEYMYDTLGFEELKNRRGEPLTTATGKRLTSRDSIAKLKATTKDQRKFKKLKDAASIKYAELSKTLEKFKKCVEEDDGILHGEFNQAVTQTHRLSSSGKKHKIQFQNFPRKFKPIFTAREEGWLIAEADAAQLEFRVAAHMGKDVRASEDIANHVDVHAFTASIIGVTRQEAKAHTFKPLYGGRSGTPREQKYYKAFREKYPDITRTQDQWIGKVISDKELQIESGLIFYWPDTHVRADGWVTNTPSICNYPVQSFATAEIIPIAVTFLWHRLRDAKMRSFLVNTIHDSAIAEVPPEEAEKYEELSTQAFTRRY